MDRNPVRLLVLSVLILSVFSFPQFIPRAHAATGVVCIAPDLPAQTACPASPVALTGPVTSGPATQIRVQVFIQGTDPMNGFDVTLLAPHALVVPIGVDLTGTIISFTDPAGTVHLPTLLAECLQGVLAAGTVCQPTDTIDTLHLAAVAPAGFPGGTTPLGASGLLFTAIYRIVGSAPAGTAVGYQTGCSVSTTSVAGTTTCVDISNGTTTPVPESVRSGTFSSSTTQPSLAEAPASTTLGNAFPGTVVPAQTVTATDTNGWAAFMNNGGAPFNGDTTITFAVAVVPPSTTATGVTAALGVTTPIDFCPGGICAASVSDALTITNGATASSGLWTIIVTGTYHFDPNCIPGSSCPGPASTLFESLFFTLNVEDYSYNIGGITSGALFLRFWCSPSPPGVMGPCPVGNSGSATITVGPNGYTGSVALTNSVPSPATVPALSVVLSPASIAGGSGTATATFSGGLLRPTTTTGQYIVSTSATGTLAANGVFAAQTRTRSVTVVVRPQDFNVTTSNGTPTGPSLSFASGGSTTDTLTLGSLPSGSAAINSAGFAGQVTLSSQVAGGTGLTVGFATNPVTLTGGGKLTDLITFGGTVTSTTVFSVTITGTATLATSTPTTQTHSVTYSVTIMGAQKDSTSSSISCSPGAINVGQTSSCTATIVDTTTASNIPSGMVTFTLNAGTTGGSLSSTTCTLSATGSCSVTFQGATAGGTATVGASYGGDTTHNGSTSATPATITATAPKDNTSTSVACSPSSINTGQTSSCIATVTDTTTATNIPAGTATFTLSSGTTGGSLSSTTCTLSATGSCSVTFQGATAAGTATVSASYGGDTTHNPSASATSASIVVTVPKVNTATAVVCAPNSISTTQTSSCLAAVTSLTPGSSTPSGTITFTLNAGTTGGSLSSTTCTLDATGGCSVMFQGASAAGTATVSASYGGDATHNGSSSSASATITVSPPAAHPTTTAVSCNPNPVLAGQQTTCTATVTDTASAPTTPSGTITFTVPLPAGGTINPTCTLAGTGATASCSISPISFLVAFTANIQASFPGTATQAPSSGSTTVVANLRSTAIGVTCSPSTIDVGQATSCTATVTDFSTVGTAILPTGTVTFAPAATGTCTLSGAGGAMASCIVAIPALPAPGSLSVTATYAGDSAHSGSGPSSAFTVTVNARTTSTTVACPATGTVGTAFTCTVTVQDTDTGTSSTPAGTFTVNGQSCVLSAGACMISLTPTASGPLIVTANYPGDTTHAASTGSATVNIGPAVDNTTTSISCSPSSINTGQTSSCTATVTDTTNAVRVPSGMITFTLNAGTTGGSLSATTCTISIQLPPGSCSVTFQGATTGGTASVSASYGGDATHNPSSSATSATITVAAPAFDYSLSNNGPITIQAGSSGTVTITATLISGTAQAVTLSCVPVPPVAQVFGCDSFNPTSVTPTGSSILTISILPITTPVDLSIQVTATPLGTTTTPTIVIVHVTVPQKDNTSTSVSCSPGSINTGQTSSCTATVTDTTTATSIPSGPVTFTLIAGSTGGSLSSTTCTLSATGSCSVTFQGATAAGAASVSESYGGDATHNPSSSTVAATITVTVPLDTTSTSVACSPGSINTSQTSSCTASVTDTTTASNIPSGTVTFTLDAGTTGGSLSSTICTLSATTGSCSVTFQGATSGGTATISASYGGDAIHNPSTSEVSATITVTPPTGQPILLTFQAFNFTAFHNGIGPFTVLVNGHVVVVFPGHGFVSSSSTIVFGNDHWVTLGPFDITQFVIQGQNNVTFVNTFGMRFSLIRNVMVTQGDTTFLNFKGPRFISPSRPLTLTFSNPPLVITAFTISGSAMVEQNVTFTVSFTGGTAPFKCIFSFGDDESATVGAVGNTCSATHDFDDPGSFNVKVTVMGSSTSDRVSSSLSVTVTGLNSSSALGSGMVNGVQTGSEDDD